MRWPYPVKPYTDELLSSYLVRTAHRHGLSPYRFCAFHFPTVAIWNRDIDRSASDSLIESIASMSGQPSSRIYEMTLRKAERKMGSSGLLGTGCWINTVGIFHRKRRGWGQQYCPDCLAEQPVFLRSWRMSFVFTCSRHQIYLQDACPHCDAPLAIHRQQLTPQLCHLCSKSLVEKPHSLHASIDSLCQAQHRYEIALASDRAPVGSETVDCRDFFVGTHVLACLMKLGASTVANRTPRTALELARIDERSAVVLELDNLLTTWPASFKALAKERHLTQQSFVSWSLPTWLATAVGGLPKGSARLRVRENLHDKLATSRRNGNEWRTERAELLWRAAKR